jgi:hypothetical protein
MNYLSATNTLVKEGSEDNTLKCKEERRGLHLLGARLRAIIGIVKAFPALYMPAR